MQILPKKAIQVGAADAAGGTDALIVRFSPKVPVDIVQDGRQNSGVYLRVVDGVRRIAKRSNPPKQSQILQHRRQILPVFGRPNHLQQPVKPFACPSRKGIRNSRRIKSKLSGTRSRFCIKLLLSAICFAIFVPCSIPSPVDSIPVSGKFMHIITA